MTTALLPAARVKSACALAEQEVADKLVKEPHNRSKILSGEERLLLLQTFADAVLLTWNMIDTPVMTVSADDWALFSHHY